MRINEIFYSLQGEGHWAGTPAVFIRFAGCNLACPFCDTDHSSRMALSCEAIVREASRFPARRVILTGGEPSLQVTPELISALHDAGFKVHIETNGSHPLPQGIDWVTCSPKEGADVVTDRINELKVVFTGHERSMEHFLSIPAAEYYLQPCDVGNPDENARITALAVDYIKAHPHWRLSLQTHKLINIR